MGYTTEFTGHVTVTPPLNTAEAAFLHAFSETRRQTVPEGPYATRDYINSELPAGASDWPPEGQPSRWCDWAPTGDGTGIEWNRVEKFQDADVWMQYLIDHFLRPGAHAQGLPGFEEFTFDHAVNGTIGAQGEDPDDAWNLVVTDNAAEKVELESPSARLKRLIDEYQSLRACGQPVTVALMDEIAELKAAVGDEED